MSVIVCRESGPLMSVLDFQTKFAFAGVSDYGLEQLHGSFDGAKPLDMSKLSGNYTRLLRLACLSHLKPDLSQLEANIASQTGDKLITPDLGTLPVDPNLLTELVSPQEAQAILATIASAEAEAAFLKLDCLQRAGDIKKTFKLAMPKALAKKVVKPPSKIGKWVAPVTTDTDAAFAYLLSKCPPSEFIKHGVDKLAGRFRLTSPYDKWNRSVSWTKRGYGKAVTESLCHSWEHYSRLTGLPPPSDLDELPNYFGADQAV